jgi:hypothetical protein
MNERLTPEESQAWLRDVCVFESSAPGKLARSADVTSKSKCCEFIGNRLRVSATLRVVRYEMRQTLRGTHQ